MQNESTEFRNRLIEAQQTTPGLREEYRKQLDAMLNHKLTPQTRLLMFGLMLASLATTALCIRSLIIHHAKPGVKILLPTYAAVFLALAAWFGKVLWQGGFARRSWFNITEQLGSIFVGVFVAVTFFHGMFAPADPVSAYWAIWAVLLAVVGFAWATGSRITAASFDAREHMLRLESRLADLAERLPKPAESNRIAGK